MKKLFAILFFVMPAIAFANYAIESLFSSGIENYCASTQDAANQLLSLRIQECLNYGSGAKHSISVAYVGGNYGYCVKGSCDVCKTPLLLRIML